PLVLVDDELSTGRTALNTISALHRRWPRRRYLIATLVDVRSDADRDRVRQAADRLGARIDVVALASGKLWVPEDALAVGRELAERQVDPGPAAGRPAEPGPVLTGWPAGLAEGGRHGVSAGDHARLARAAGELAGSVANRLRDAGVSADGTRRILVLGTEELMYAPLRIATALAGELADATVRFSSTTRSPVVAVDDAGYPIRDRIAFAGSEEPGQRWAYNVAGTVSGERFTDIVLVTDTATDTATDTEIGRGPDGLLGRLTAVTDRLLVVRLPAHQPDPPAMQGKAPLPEPLTGPAFGSYPAEDVAWLLTDLSGVRLEAPTEEREEAIQSGAAHYAESLPQEYQPSAEYRQLFDAALAEQADRLAHAVGVVTELILDRRGPGVVLASLARAGTPVGVLMRRWAKFAHGLALPHYSVSIVRGRGIDTLALAYLARHHGPAAVQFVDGWTGKGAITKELSAAITAVNQAHRPDGCFSAELAVLADPGSCVPVFGSREDYLIPSACLNSTVSGLVSRTVLNRDLIGPHQFHGAKFYAELAPDDVSQVFVDTVAARFAAVAERVARDWPVLRDADRRPTWAGWDSVRRLSERYRIGDENLVKPGVGETTRVLLRRVPDRVLIRTGDGEKLRHVLLLATQRGVPVEEVDGLAFSCVGLIAPRRAQRPEPRNGGPA
ncbi:MAG: TRSP domain-containing protein, partial [Actinobacteria bacterium]|nr:TRSP domain-containing protein [Actinomycetota bacterium]